MQHRGAILCAAQTNSRGSSVLRSSSNEICPVNPVRLLLACGTAVARADRVPGGCRSTQGPDSPSGGAARTHRGEFCRRPGGGRGDRGRAGGGACASVGGGAFVDGGPRSGRRPALSARNDQRRRGLGAAQAPYAGTSQRDGNPERRHGSGVWPVHGRHCQRQRQSELRRRFLQEVGGCGPGLLRLESFGNTDPGWREDVQPVLPARRLPSALRWRHTAGRACAKSVFRHILRERLGLLGGGTRFRTPTPCGTGFRRVTGDRRRGACP